MGQQRIEETLKIGEGQLRGEREDQKSEQIAMSQRDATHATEINVGSLELQPFIEREREYISVFARP